MLRPASNLTNHKASDYSENASFVYSAKFTNAVLGLLDAKPGERIIDLGCGTGELTRQIREAVGSEGTTVGADSSEDMLAKAERSSDGIEFIRTDIQKLSTDPTIPPEWHHSFDKVFTSATLHWCKADPAGVIESVKWLLKPGGVFIYEFGGYGNAIGVRSALHQALRKRGINPIPRDPWYYPTDRQYANLLKQRGMTPMDTGLYPRPTPLPTGLKGWLKMFARNTFLTGLEADVCDEITKEVEDVCRVDMYWNDAYPGMGEGESAEEQGEDGWEMMYVRLRGVARYEG